MFEPILLALSLATSSQPGASQPSTATPQGLPKASVEALTFLLEDERRAEALYAAVIRKHGEWRPFSNIVEAERRHQCALEGLFEAHHLPIPPNAWKNRTPEAPGTFKEACEAGIQTELENVALYDRFLKTVTEPDLLEVLERLRWASLERHLVAFRRQVGQ